jgi:hypothetical protein
MLSIRGTDFIACWAYEERVSAHAQPAVKCEHFYMNNACWASRNEFYRTLSIRGTNFIACWAYWEPISSHAEHARKCLKVDYLGQIEHDFQKSRVTGPWDHKDSVSAKKVKKKFHACVPLNMPAVATLKLCQLFRHWNSVSCWSTKKLPAARTPKPCLLQST